jgi:hypothetical protein
MRACAYRFEVDRLVEVVVNASLPRSIDAATLARCLQTIPPDPAWLPHLIAFFTELPIIAIDTFAAEHHVSRAELRRCYDAVFALTGERNQDVDEWFRYLEAAPASRA